ncbi:MAG: methyltransferase domain-containing protein [Actinobacteria bacterium]|nr:methyltransferase domain-containing protein [Actinomycetota bacterium]
MTALDLWRAQLEAWQIPPAILAAAPEPPWGFPAELFRNRAAGSGAGQNPTTRRGAEALPEGGSVLDVGCGGGATSLPLASRAGLLVGLDGQADMLPSFARAAEIAGVDATTICAGWPEDAHEVEPADVVMCGHVLYNVADVRPFLEALDRHARHRVVLELTAEHPLAWTKDLWERFHGLPRPLGPRAEDALAAIREIGVTPHRQDGRERENHPTGGGFARREDAIALVRRRLCLSATHDPQIEAALGPRLREHGGRWSAGPREQEIVTIWWDRPEDSSILRPSPPATPG